MEYLIPTKSKIISIDSEYTPEDNKHRDMHGLHIVTNKGNITLIMGDWQSCCESYGMDFLETPDDISKFIGATIISISDTNDRELRPNDTESNETQLRIVTNRGILQYAVYNSHNGYYSHTTFLQVFDLVETSSL